VKVIAMLLRFWSYLFAFVLGLFAAGVSAVLLISGSSNFRLDMLPFWKGESALYGLFAIGLLGAVSAILAILGKARALLVLFCAVAFALLVYGFYVSPVYRFQGAAEAKSILWVALGALVAVFGSLMQFRKERA
jgi:hypothetical protein